MSDADSTCGSFLSCLSASAREKVLSLAQSMHYSAGQTIFSGGDPSARVFIVKSGRVGIVIHIPSRNSVTMLTLGPGDLFSWSALVAPYIETATARALEDTTALAVSGSALMDACEQDPRVGYDLYRALTHVLTTRLRATRLQLLDVFAQP